MDVMLDLETMGNAPTSAIIAVGAVKFDPAARRIVDKFYSRVDLQSCMDAGLVVSADTIMWWLQQSDAARGEFKGTLPKLKMALDGFTLWMNKITATPGDSHRVWGNGATFDNVILTSAYKALKMERPWTYKGDRCYRTIRSLFPNVPFRDFGTAHRADHDAEAQAMHLMDIWPHIYAQK